MHVSDETLFSLSGTGPILLEWKEKGFKMQIPKGAISGPCGCVHFASNRFSIIMNSKNGKFCPFLLETAVMKVEFARRTRLQQFSIY